VVSFREYRVGCDVDTFDSDSLRELDLAKRSVVSEWGYFATRRGAVSSSVSIDAMLKRLEERVAHHRERQEFHAERETFHRERMTQHAAGLETALAHLEAFRAAAVAAGELLQRDRSTVTPSPEPDDPDLDKQRSLSRMIARVLEDRSADETFGARSVTWEIQQRWGAKLRRKPDPRSVAATLRRWALTGRIHQVRAGRAHYESLYRKTPEATSPVRASG
jgi:hypothetical protein